MGRVSPYKPESRSIGRPSKLPGPTELVHVLSDPVLDIAIKYAVQLGAHVYVQIAASGFDPAADYTAAGAPPAAAVAKPLHLPSHSTVICPSRSKSAR